ncbi:hypothetical protein [Pseudooceanicola sp.]|uniref:hypothetical protein n=1 Tax=Pseudooceanicola sp. TaxID=1914328 RepID=UPI0035C6886B
MCTDTKPQWHRSYPPESFGGVKWMLDALEDLMLFAEDRNLDDVARELRSARSAIAPILQTRR